ncbi:AP2/B3 transcription factor family protein [Euphorbia peplus]|nr:AP2/B3 transcription factor family protein [Euphorbia peplus]
MTEDAVSIVLDSTIEEVSNSNNNTRSFPTTEHERLGSKTYRSKFRGVVPLPNGHWGCQIYANHQRIWLGTFKSENEAAMSYDSAALKLRSGDCRRNFPLTDVKEPDFQSYYSTEALVNMIKDGSYQVKFADFVSTRHEPNSIETERLRTYNRTPSIRKVSCTQLFQKELTPSDVGKLNRLVIPKKCAVKFFANLPARTEQNVGVNVVDDGLLTFLDKSMKLWKFRYCYWKSSHSYVFTRGWNRFVKDKQLKASETIVFSLCQCWENGKVAQTYHMIDVLKNENRGSLLAVGNERVSTGMECKFELGRDIGSRANNDSGIMDVDETKIGNEACRKSFRLFGTEIV